jgi:Mn-dependent DtxR family transcriptional regulator
MRYNGFPSEKWGKLLKLNGETYMSAKQDIMKILNRRKNGLTSFDLDDRLPDVTWKTVRNTLGDLMAEGVVEYDDFKYLHNDRYVNAYRSVV